jgi:hypothetical protein
MRVLSADIDINAQADEVWRVLVDFPAYPDWNPFIRRISGRLAPGARLSVYIQSGEKPGRTFRPVVRSLEPGRTLCWLGHVVLPGIFDGEHCFTIEPIGPTRVRFVQRERFGGLLVPILWGAVERDTKRGFEAMNVALKARVERSESGRGHNDGLESEASDRPATPDRSYQPAGS